MPRINVDHNAGPWGEHTEYLTAYIGDMEIRTPINVLTPQLRAGVQHRTGPGGMMIYMYYDNPGHYYDEQGHEVSDKAAKAAGFPVDFQMKERRRLEAMGIAEREIAKKFEHSSEIGEVVEVRGDYAIVKASGGFYNIVDKEVHSVRFNGQGPLRLEDAQDVLNVLVPEVAEVVEPKGKTGAK